MKKLFLTLLSLFVSSFSQAATPNGQDPLLVLASVAADASTASSATSQPHLQAGDTLLQKKYRKLEESALDSDSEGEESGGEKSGPARLTFGQLREKAQAAALEKGITKHDKEEKKHTCITCKKNFLSPFALKQHMRIHTGEKPFKCSMCEQAFTQKASLKQHTMTHTGERPFQCSMCTQAFIQSGALKTHMMTHTGERPFQCSMCERAFIQKDTLKQHMRIHTGERPFKCSMCEQAFAQKSTLQRHMRIHTGERPCHCDICGMDFIQPGHLEKHKKSAAHIRQKDALAAAATMAAASLETPETATREVL